MWWEKQRSEEKNNFQQYIFTNAPPLNYITNAHVHED